MCLRSIIFFNNEAKAYFSLIYFRLMPQACFSLNITISEKCREPLNRVARRASAGEVTGEDKERVYHVKIYRKAQSETAKEKKDAAVRKKS